MAPITSRGQTMAKNGPGVALNRPQDTERYNAKDSIVRRAVKCFCLVSKTKWATLSVSSRSLSVPFQPGRALSPSPFVTSLPSCQFGEDGGGRGFLRVAETAAGVSHSFEMKRGRENNRGYFEFN